MDAVMQLIAEFAAKYPVLSTVFMVMGILRAVFKPLFSLLRAYVLSTPNPADDAALDRIEQSGPVKAIAWALDYLASVKLPVK